MELQGARILVVVSNVNADAPLVIRPEVAAIVRTWGSDKTTVVYNPRRLELAEAIAQAGEGTQVLHLLGHTSDDGFLLADGFLSPASIASYALSLAPELRLVLLNTCTGSSIADAVSVVSNADVIWFEAELADEKGIEFALLFYAKLDVKDVTTYYDAFRRVATDPRFKYRKGKTSLTHTVDVAKYMNGPSDTIIEVRLGKIETALEKIEVALLGNLEDPNRGILNRTSALVKVVDSHELRLQNLEKAEAARSLSNSSHESSDREFYRRLTLLLVGGTVAVILILLLAYARPWSG